jgi:murein tripeptide amidase MpaA
VQYGYQDILCNPLIDALANNKSLVQAYADYVLNHWVPLLNPDGTWTYSTQFQADTSVAENKNERQWWWQTCTELAYFQNAPAKNRCVLMSML